MIDKFLLDLATDIGCGSRNSKNATPLVIVIVRLTDYILTRSGRDLVLADWSHDVSHVTDGIG